MYALTGKWYILPGNELKATTLLKKFSKDVEKNEPDTLLYKVFTPNFKEKNLPAPPAGEVVFFEIYKDEDACTKHIQGPLFTNFMKNNGHLFLQDFGNPSQVYVTVEILSDVGGFIRSELK